MIKLKNIFFLLTMFACLPSQVLAQSGAALSGLPGNVTGNFNGASLPFLYLNQYFQYDVKSPDEIFLAGKTFNFSNFKIQSAHSFAEVDLQLLKSWIIDGSTLTFKNDKNLAVSTTLISKGKWNYRIAQPATAKSICLVSMSRFSETEFCKNLVAAESAPDFQILVVANGEILDSAGLVVLKDKEGVLNFSATLSPNHLVGLKTKKRNVLPISIRKLADNDTMTIVFRDQGLTEKNAWEEKISIDQSFVILRLDPLVNLKQDLYFNETVSRKAPLSYSSAIVKATPPVRIEENGLTTEVFGIFSGLKATSPGLNVTLNSDLGKGIRTTYRWSVSAKTRGFAQAHIYQTTIIADSGNSISNNRQMPYAAAAGAEYQIRNRLSVLTQGRIQKDLFFKPSGATGVEILTGHNVEVSIAPTYQIYRATDSKLSGDLTGSYLYTSEAGGSSAFGYKAQFGLSYIRRFEFGQFAFSSQYGLRTQNFSNFKFSEQIVNYGIGYHYVF